jgi:hypothetical protein
MEMYEKFIGFQFFLLFFTVYFLFFVCLSKQINLNEKYLLLDELYDKSSKTRAKLMHPYLIELTMVEPILMYPLEYEKVINSECDVQILSTAIQTSTMKTKGNQVADDNDRYNNEEVKQKFETAKMENCITMEDRQQNHDTRNNGRNNGDDNSWSGEKSHNGIENGNNMILSKLEFMEFILCLMDSSIKTSFFQVLEFSNKRRFENVLNEFST